MDFSAVLRHISALPASQRFGDRKRNIASPDISMHCSTMIPLLLFGLLLIGRTECMTAENENDKAEQNETTTEDPRLTGDPQIDWEFDPNLPRELRGFNMSDFPFFSRVPNKIKFDCKDRIDGFYANTDYQCQVYHHCLYGIRQDFLCGNYTAFDMRTFICQFVNVVDCQNSDSYAYRNEPLYKTTTTVKPERRPFRKGAEDYEPDYYYDDYYYEDYYEDSKQTSSTTTSTTTTTTTTTATTTTQRPFRRRGGRPRRPNGSRRGPGGRRRPRPPVQKENSPAEDEVQLELSSQADDYEYYDDYVESRRPVKPIANRNRNRERPRNNALENSNNVEAAKKFVQPSSVRPKPPGPQNAVEDFNPNNKRFRQGRPQGSSVEFPPNRKQQTKKQQNKASPHFTENNIRPKQSQPVSTRQSNFNNRFVQNRPQTIESGFSQSSPRFQSHPSRAPSVDFPPKNRNHRPQQFNTQVFSSAPSSRNENNQNKFSTPVRASNKNKLEPDYSYYDYYYDDDQENLPGKTQASQHFENISFRRPIDGAPRNSRPSQPHRFPSQSLPGGPPPPRQRPSRPLTGSIQHQERVESFRRRPSEDYYYDATDETSPRFSRRQLENRNQQGRRRTSRRTLLTYF